MSLRGFLIRRDLFQKLGTFNEDYLRFAESVLAIHIVDRGYLLEDFPDLVTEHYDTDSIWELLVAMSAGRLGAHRFWAAEPELALAYFNTHHRVTPTKTSCDVVVNWSAADGFGLPTIEALACGARVVIPPDNLTSIEVGGENVVVARRADVAALREAIQVAATMPRPKPDLSRFHWATTAARLESMLWPKSKAYRQAG